MARSQATESSKLAVIVLLVLALFATFMAYHWEREERKELDLHRLCYTLPARFIDSDDRMRLACDRHAERFAELRQALLR